MKVLPIGVNSEILDLLRQDERLQRLTDLELKANAVLGFRNYLLELESKGLVEAPISAFYNIGAGWEIAIERKFGDCCLILQNKVLEIPLKSYLFRGHDSPISGNFYRNLINSKIYLLQGGVNVAALQYLNQAVSELNRILEFELRQKNETSAEAKRNEGTEFAEPRGSAQA